MQRFRVSPADPDHEAIAVAAAVLRAGGVVAYPTDTLYGLAVDPRSTAGVERLFTLKGRPAGAAIPLIAASPGQAMTAGEFGAIERKLAIAFWPGPLSIVIPALPGIAPGVLAGGTTIAIRVPAHPIARALALAHAFSITATSANRSGAPPAVSADEVAATLESLVDVLIDGGPAAGGMPSTIVEITATGPIERRAGAIAWDRVIKSLQ